MGRGIHFFYPCYPSHPRWIVLNTVFWDFPAVFITPEGCYLRDLPRIRTLEGKTVTTAQPGHKQMERTPGEYDDTFSLEGAEVGMKASDPDTQHGIT
jgi:hypothetical protein